ncbi:MAG: J domain-containing protein [Caulobacteraceae bacterium]|nr:J domain-containing protein [Caulobacteraceae bacterium]
MANDPYSELGIARSASQDEVRKAFRKLAKQHHPDKNPGDAKAEEKFKRISAAFDILGDEEKRKKFDRGEIDADGREQFRGGFGGGAGGSPFGAGGPQGFRGNFEGVDLDEIFSMFGGGGFAGQARGGRAGRGGFQAPPRGVDVRARLEVDLVDTILGATRRIQFSDGRTVDVGIPKGAQTGQVLRLKGQGQEGRGGAFGDALIELNVRPHAVFRPDGADLEMDLPVSVPDAVLGGKVEAPTPEGNVSVTVPKGSNSGSVLRLKGRGGVDPKTGKRGDLKARLVVTLPDSADSRLEAFAEDWRKNRPYQPRRR